MLLVYLQPMPNGALDRVYIARANAELRLDLAGRRSAVDWLTGQGCCPGAAAMLYDIEYGQPCEIAEPGDPGFALYVEEPTARCPLPPV